MAQTVKHLSTMQETRVQSLVWEDPLEKEMAAHSSILAWKTHGRRSLVGYRPWGHKESDTTATSLSLSLSIADSLRCTEETDSTLQSNRFLVQWLIRV